MERKGWKCPACGDLDGQHINGCRFSPPFDTDDDIRRYYEAQAKALKESGLGPWPAMNEKGEGGVSDTTGQGPASASAALLPELAAFPHSGVYAQAGFAAELAYTLGLWSEFYANYAESFLPPNSEHVRVGAVGHPLAYVLERTRILIEMWNERTRIGPQ